MKTIFKHLGIIALASLAACVSCTKEENGVDPGQKNGLRTLSISVDLATKVNSVGPTIQWDAGEENLSVIGLVDGSPRMYKFTKAAAESKSTEATFTSAVEIPASAELLYAVYPYKSDYDWDGTGDPSLSLTLKNEQSCFDNGGVSAHPLMAGKISENSVTLKQVCSFLKFTLPARSGAASYVRYIYVRGTGVAGNVDVDFSGSDPVASAGDADYMRVLTKSEGEKNGDVYVPVLPGTYSSLTIELEYTDGHSNYLRTTNNSNTLERGKYKDLGTASGPFVVSTGVSSATLDGTTLSLSGTANVWKYFGVDNSKYTFKFAYKDSEAENWTEVTADSPTGDGTAVTFTKDVTVTAGKTYNVKTVIVADGATSNSEQVNSSAAGLKTVTLSARTDIDSYVYNAPSTSDLHKIVDASDNDIFPVVSSGAARAKTWDGSAWSDAGDISFASSPYPKLLGGSFTKDGFSFDFWDTTGDTYYYLINGGAANAYFLFPIKLNTMRRNSVRIRCPGGRTIKTITIAKPASGSLNLNWNIYNAGTDGGSYTALTEGTNYSVDASTAGEKGGKKVFTILTPISGNCYWLGLTSSSYNGFQTITVEYE